jgi:hypothetical protein
MRRRPQIHGQSSTRRAGPPVDASPGEGSNSFALFGEGPIEAELLQRALQGAIDQVTARFDEAQSEYQLVTADSRDWHKWKGEMIAYANVVALLEDLKSHPVLAG